MTKLNPNSIFLRNAFQPDFSVRRLNSTDDVNKARSRFTKSPTNNLKLLLENRYVWMNDFIHSNDVGIEIGSGAGLAEFFITNENLIMTDNFQAPWLKQKMDALAMDLEDESVDYIISSNVIHHLAYPLKFLLEANRVLRPGGVLLVNESTASLAMRSILRIMRHEGYNFDVDAYDLKRPCCDPEHLWAGNAVIWDTAMSDVSKLREKTGFEVEYKKQTEFLLFLLSGGVTAEAPTIKLPNFLLSMICGLDKALISVAPNFFALGWQTALKKTAS